MSLLINPYNPYSANSYNSRKASNLSFQTGKPPLEKGKIIGLVLRNDTDEGKRLRSLLTQEGINPENLCAQVMNIKPNSKYTENKNLNYILLRITKFSKTKTKAVEHTKTRENWEKAVKFVSINNNEVDFTLTAKDNESHARILLAD